MSQVCRRIMAVVPLLAGLLLVLNAVTADSPVMAAETDRTGKNAVMQILVKSNGQTVTFELNNSRAAIDLVAQLPLDIAVENYGGIEKIFYPPKKLDTVDTPLAGNVTAGLLAYYAPWGNVVMFFDDFRPADGLYELGRVVDGGAGIANLSGTIRVENVSAPDN